MSITFRIENGRDDAKLNFFNSNAAALLSLAGVSSKAYGEIDGEQLHACIHRLLHVANSANLRAPAASASVEAPRWYEAARTDRDLRTKVDAVLALLVSARKQGCGVTWG